MLRTSWMRISWIQFKQLFSFFGGGVGHLSRMKRSIAEFLAALVNISAGCVCAERSHTAMASYQPARTRTFVTRACVCARADVHHVRRCHFATTLNSAADWGVDP